MSTPGPTVQEGVYQFFSKEPNIFLAYSQFVRGSVTTPTFPRASHPYKLLYPHSGCPHVFKSLLSGDFRRFSGRISGDFRRSSEEISGDFRRYYLDIAEMRNCNKKHTSAISGRFSFFPSEVINDSNFFKCHKSL